MGSRGARAGLVGVVAAVLLLGCTRSAPPPSCDPCAAPPTSRPPAPLTTTMSLDLLVGGELPPDAARALASGTSEPCPLTVHRPGNRLGLEVGSVVRFTPTLPPYGRTPTATTPTLPGATTAATAATATVTIDTAVTAFIYLGPHVDADGNLLGAGCRFTGRGVIPNASEWLVQLPDGTTLTHRASSRPVEVLGATFGAG